MRKDSSVSLRLSVIGILLLAGVGLSASPKGGGSDTPVTSLIAGAGLPDDPTGFQIQSDGKGSYKNATDGVGSVLQKGTLKEWQLDTSSSTVRSAYIDFQYPVSGTANTPPFSHAKVPTRVETKCYISNTIGPGDMTGLNSTLDCVLLIAFTYGGENYGIHMWPQLNAGTNMARITCTGVSGNTADPSSPCIQWTIAPTSTNPYTGKDANIAKLIRQVTVRRTKVDEDHGDFYFSFLITVTNP